MYETKSVQKSLIIFLKLCFTVTQNFGKIQRLLNKFISIKTFQTYVHILKRCRFVFYSSITLIWGVTRPIYGRVLSLFLRSSFCSKNRSTPAKIPVVWDVWSGPGWAKNAGVWPGKPRTIFLTTILSNILLICEVKLIAYSFPGCTYHLLYILGLLCSV